MGKKKYFYWQLWIPRSDNFVVAKEMNYLDLGPHCFNFVALTAGVLTEEEMLGEQVYGIPSTNKAPDS